MRKLILVNLFISDCDVLILKRDIIIKYLTNLYLDELKKIL